MYKYKQTTDVEVGDLVVWTELLPNNPYITKNKVYKVLGKINKSLVTVLSDNNTAINLGKAQGFKVIQTKPASEAIVGDYMYRISSGSGTFPQHSVVKITRTSNERLGYSEELGADFYEVIVIAQAEQTSEYPVFKEDKVLGFIFKYTGPNEGIYLTNKGIPNRKPGDYSSAMIPRHRDCWKPCDFTIEPDIDDIDWWQQRFEEELPVYVIGKYGYTDRCMSIPPKNWDKNYTFSMTDPSLIQKVPMSKEDIELFKQQVPLSTLHLGLCNEIPLGATTDCSLQPIIKEQPMDKTTLKLLLELLGASQEVKDATNSKFVGIITNEDEYVGYMYFDSKEDATECMAQPKMELHKLHLFEKSCVLAQKPRKVIEI